MKAVGRSCVLSESQSLMPRDRAPVLVWSRILGVLRPAAALGVFLSAGIASADVQIGLALSNLQSSDFRLRTQAALALGASKSAQAVEPLCKTLTDENVSVRTAAAAA